MCKKKCPLFVTGKSGSDALPKQNRPKTLGKSESKKIRKSHIADIFKRFAEINPQPVGELHYVNAYTLLVAVVLSAQSTDKGVNKATDTLFKHADTPQKMIELGEAALINYIKTIGLYRNKAKNVIALSQKLISEFGGEVPCDLAHLQSLPGVGRKTANVVLNMAFGQATMAVDTHVFRVSHRLGLSFGKNVDVVERDLVANIPEEFMLHAHHWLILHGRYTCKARTPECWRCPVIDLCGFKFKTAAKSD